MAPISGGAVTCCRLSRNYTNLLDLEKMPRAGFYRVTRNALFGITQLYDFIWPATAAVWNLRWQIKGYMLEAPTATETQLREKFAHPEGGGSNYRNFGKGFAATTWVEQERRIASFFLATLIAEYEAWARAILFAATQSDSFADDNQKGLQFPTSGKKGLGPTLKKALSKTSPAMVAAFQPTLTRHPRYVSQNLESLMSCFRCFKEIRNSFAHGGGLVSQKVLDAETLYRINMIPARIGMAAPPEWPPQPLGEPILIGLKQVAGLSEVILRIMVTLDGFLAQTKGAEVEFLETWVTAYGTNKRFLPSDAKKRRLKIAKAAELAGLPKPLAGDELPKLLKANDLIFF